MPCQFNNIECPCTKEGCPRHGKCCECVKHHREHGKKLPACLSVSLWEDINRMWFVNEIPNRDQVVCESRRFFLCLIVKELRKKCQKSASMVCICQIFVVPLHHFFGCPNKNLKQYIALMALAFNDIVNTLCINMLRQWQKNNLTIW